MSLTSNVFATSIKGGTATASGDASNKVFSIAHGLGSVPTTVTIEYSSVDTLGSRVVTKDANNIIISYEVAPPAGTNNLVWMWTAIKVVV